MSRYVKRLITIGTPNLGLNEFNIISDKAQKESFMKSVAGFAIKWVANPFVHFYFNLKGQGPKTYFNEKG